VRRFRYLDETIAVILAFVGDKILADDVVHLGDVASLAVIVGLLGCCVAASVLRTASLRRTPPRRRGGARPACPEQLTPRWPKPEEAPVAQR
jgi:predicted tellurium resistance membrane protein TerC